MLSSFDMESKHLYLNYNNKKLTTNEEIRSLEDKYNSIFVKNDFKNLTFKDIQAMCCNHIETLQD